MGGVSFPNSIFENCRTINKLSKNHRALLPMKEPLIRKELTGSIKHLLIESDPSIKPQAHYTTQPKKAYTAKVRRSLFASFFMRAVRCLGVKNIPLL